MDVSVKMGKLVPEKPAPELILQPSEEIGLAVNTISPNLAQQYNVTPGVGVLVTSVEPGSVAALAGISQGTVILQVDRKSVNNAKEFASALNTSIQDRSVLLLLLKNNVQRYLVLSW